MSGKPHPYVLCEDWEADDGMALAQTKDTCICSNDKDLRMVQGNHYSWKVGERVKEKPMVYVSEAEGLNWFFQQLLMGDSTDNIPGLYRVGPTSAKKLLGRLSEPLRMYSIVREEYKARFGSYWRMFMHENATLLWMLLKDPLVYDPTKQVSNYLDDLEEQWLKEITDDKEF